MTEKETKHHKACDECRIRKLKCPGESPTCSRCQRDGVPCIYSVQKTMGRPRKRRRSDALRAHHVASAGANGTMSSYQSSMACGGNHGVADTIGAGSNASQWLEGTMFLGDESRLLDLNILGPIDSHQQQHACMSHPSGAPSTSSPFDPSMAGSTDTMSTDLDTLFTSSTQNMDFSSLLSELAPAQDDTSQRAPETISPSTPLPHQHCETQAPVQPYLSNVIDHTKMVPMEMVGSATLSPSDYTAFNIQPDHGLGLNCNCLIHFFGAIMTLKKMIYNPVHLSPPTPFSTPPPPITLEEIQAISTNAIDITKTSLKCASCNMCFTTLMNVGQLLGLLLRAYSQFLHTSGTFMPRAEAKRIVDDEMDKILDILGQVEIRSLARHGMTLGEHTGITKDMVGRGVIERLATGNWVGDRNPLCLKIVNMVRGLADGLLCGVGVGECVPGQCNSGLNTIS